MIVAVLNQNGRAAHQDECVCGRTAWPTGTRASTRECSTMASAFAASSMTAAVPLPSLPSLVIQPRNKPLTRVSLIHIEERINVDLRFGEPVRIVRLDRWRRCAMFPPGAMFCVIRWQANDIGTTPWQLMVMQSGTPLDTMQRIPGVRPGAHLLLNVKGENAVRAVLERIGAIEALGIATIDVSPAYWRTLGNRSEARLPLPEYTVERHASWLARRTLP